MDDNLIGAINHQTRQDFVQHTDQHRIGIKLNGEGLAERVQNIQREAMSVRPIPEKRLRASMRQSIGRPLRRSGCGGKGISFFSIA